MDSSNDVKPINDSATSSQQAFTLPEILHACLNLHDIETLASRTLTPEAWAYYASASDDSITKSLNSEVSQKILLRPRALVEVSTCSTSTSILGHDVQLPFFVSPAARAGLAHPSGEGAIVEACEKYGVLRVISFHSSISVEEIVASAPRTQVFGWQLSVQTDRLANEAIIRRISLLPQIKFICLSVDCPVSGKRELDERLALQNKDEEGTGISKKLFMGTACDLSWSSTIPWLPKHTHLPIVLKGIQTWEDAVLATRYP